MERRIVTLALFLALPVLCLAQPNIVATNPVQAAIDVSAIEPIEIAFDRSIDQASLQNSIYLNGSLHGRYDFTWEYDPAGSLLQVRPVPSFMDGENISLVLSASLRASDGSTLASGFRLGFRTETPRGNILAGFADSVDIFLPESDKQPVKIATGDFDHDAFIDAAVINSSSNTLSIFLNSTRTSFFTNLVHHSTYESGLTPIDIATADFNRDGHLDLAIASLAGNHVTIAAGQGDGSFVLQEATLSVGIRPSGLAVGDFDNDGLQDLAVSLMGEDKVVIFMNGGAASFVHSFDLICQAGTFAVTAADFDGDGDVDIAAANNGAKSVSFFLNGLGNWTALPVREVPSRPIAIRTGNVTGVVDAIIGDRRQEVIVLSADLTVLGKSAVDTTGDQSQISVFQFNSGNASMDLAQLVTYGNRAQAFALGNMDREVTSPVSGSDQDLDIILADYVGGSIQYLINQDNRGWFNNFARIDRASNPRTVEIADFNRDGAMDILYANHFENKLRLLLTRPGGGRLPVYIIDFGDVLVGTTASRTINVSLYGSLNVTVDVEVQNQDNFDVQPRTFSNRNGTALPIAVSFSPSDTLNYQTLAIFTSDYALETEPAVLIIRGRGVDVDFDIFPAVLDFKSVPPGLSKTLSLTVVNNANGFLELTSFISSLPEFSHTTEPLFVQPYDTAHIPVTFSPQAIGEYMDYLIIQSNDISKPSVSIDLIGRSGTGAPRITSPDTAVAVEHESFYYIATAEDPDGDEVEFSYEALPGWVRASGDSVYGVPPEGAQDTAFIVRASDGFLEDTLRVTLIVIPVNDPPYFENLEVQQIVEGDPFQLDIVAIDPEGEALVISAQNLPGGASFQDNGNNTATISWMPPFQSSGTYDIPLTATETNSMPPLSGRAVLRIIVGRKLPDIRVAEVNISRSGIRLNQEAVISAVIQNDAAPVIESFSVQLLVAGTVVFDSTVVGMQPEASFIVTRSVPFTQLGEVEITAVADVDDAVPEVNEENNTLTIRTVITLGQLLVRPNPFTPNDDGRNDEVVFDMVELAVANPELLILDLHGKVLRRLNTTRGTTMQWDGKDTGGQVGLPGVYLYILEDGGENVAKGYIVLAR
jgi:hypothetical protein